MMKLAAFDLEIAAVVPDSVEDWAQLKGLGVSCAATAFSDQSALRLWEGRPRLSQDECRQLVELLLELEGRDYRLVSWNGCSFDFRVLAEESGLWAECGQLALNHTDLMLMVTFTKGWYLGLQTALRGAGLEGKLHQVQLSDGTAIHDMDGSRAPELWAAGEHEAVLSYLRQDVIQTLRLAETVMQRRQLEWTSRRGTPQSIPVPRLLTVRECFDIPEPDTSWMNNPPRREQFVSWIEQPPMGAGLQSGGRRSPNQEP